MCTYALIRSIHFLKVFLESDGKPYVGLIESIYVTTCGAKIGEAYTIAVRWFFRWCDLPRNTDKPKDMCVHILLRATEI